MRILELFKGGGSITEFFKDNEDVEVISLDILEKYKPSIVCDIMEFDYKQYEPGYFDIIWASPECKIFSSLQYSWIGRKWKDRNELDDERIKHSKFINKTIEIIDYLKPKTYFIENPLYSSIWNYVENKEYLENCVIVDYCYFGFDYKKPTKILTNKNLENKRCKCEIHKSRIGITNEKLANGKNSKHKRQFQDTTNLIERYSIPQKLLEYLFNYLPTTS
jgi:hypothetical protein